MAERQTHQGEWLRQQIAVKGWSASKFSVKAGVSRDALHKWMRQEQLQIRLDTAVRVLRALGFSGQPNIRRPMEEGFSRGSQDSTNPLVRWAGSHYVQSVIRRAIRDSERVIVDNNAPPSLAEGSPVIPIIDAAVAAGPWVFVGEVLQMLTEEAVRRGLFRVRISGDSMVPKYLSGWLVEFQVIRDPATELKIGKDYYFQQGDQATFKRLEAIEGDELVLRALNRKKYRAPFRVRMAELDRIARAVYKLLDTDE